jgi:hypothetical protein
MTPMTRSGRCAFQQAQLAELREHLVLGLLADGAGVDQDQVGFALVGGQLQLRSRKRPATRSESYSFIWQP